jgi:hypothetical protein
LVDFFQLRRLAELYFQITEARLDVSSVIASMPIWRQIESPFISSVYIGDYCDDCELPYAIPVVVFSSYMNFLRRGVP